MSARFIGESYNVGQRGHDATGEKPSKFSSPDHWEYEIIDTLADDVWDSLLETYNGLQKLTADEAAKWASETAEALNSGKRDPADFGFKGGLK